MLERLALATDSGLTLTPLEVSYLRRAVRVALREARDQHERDGTFGRRVSVLERLERVVSAATDADEPLRLTIGEGR